MPINVCVYIKKWIQAFDLSIPSYLAVKANEWVFCRIWRVGKSVLMSMIAKFSSADVIVIGLIGERGREVKRVH